MRDELIVGGMVHRFDADDLLDQRVVMLVHVLDELELRRRWTDDEDFFHLLEGTGDLVIEAFRICRMLPLGRRLLASMNVMMRSLEGRRVEALRSQVKNLGFVVIDPNSSMAGGHGRYRAILVPLNTARFQ
jgi:hypothetical protein